MLREALVSRPNAGPPSSDPLNQSIFQYFDGIFSILHRSVPIMLNYAHFRAPFFSILGYSFSILPLEISKNTEKSVHLEALQMYAVYTLYDLLLAVKKVLTCLADPCKIINYFGLNTLGPTFCFLEGVAFMCLTLCFNRTRSKTDEPHSCTTSACQPTASPYPALCHGT